MHSPFPTKERGKRLVVMAVVWQHTATVQRLSTSHREREREREREKERNRERDGKSEKESVNERVRGKMSE